MSNSFILVPGSVWGGEHAEQKGDGQAFYLHVSFSRLKLLLELWVQSRSHLAQGSYRKAIKVWGWRFLWQCLWQRTSAAWSDRYSWLDLALCMWTRAIVTFLINVLIESRASMRAAGFPALLCSQVQPLCPQRGVVCDTMAFVWKAALAFHPRWMTSRP